MRLGRLVPTAPRALRVVGAALGVGFYGLLGNSGPRLKSAGGRAWCQVPATPTADLYDAFGNQDGLQIAGAGGFRDYGRVDRFAGPAETIKCFEANALVRKCLSEPGRGRVLVVDGGGSSRCALLGDNLGTLAVENGWAGVVVYGYVRDAEILGTMQVGVKALGTHPRKSDKRLVGEVGLVVAFHGLVIAPGDYVYADVDGFVVSKEPLELPKESTQVLDA